MISLYPIGTVFRIVVVLLFFSIITVIGYLSVRLHLQEKELRELSLALVSCSELQELSEKNNKALKANIITLDNYYRRLYMTKPPIFVGGELNIANLFGQNPR